MVFCHRLSCHMEEKSGAAAFTTVIRTMMLRLLHCDWVLQPISEPFCLTVNEGKGPCGVGLGGIEGESVDGLCNHNIVWMQLSDPPVAVGHRQQRAGILWVHADRQWFLILNLASRAVPKKIRMRMDRMVCVTLTGELLQWRHWFFTLPSICHYPCLLPSFGLLENRQWWDNEV